MIEKVIAAFLYYKADPEVIQMIKPKKNIQNVCVTNSGIQTNGAESIIIIILYKGFTKFGLCIL